MMTSELDVALLMMFEAEHEDSSEKAAVRDKNGVSTQSSSDLSLRLTFEHFGHERRHSFLLRVSSADTRENRIDDGNASGFARHEAADLRHQRDHSDLTNVGRFASHVWTSHDLHIAATLLHDDVVRNELCTQATTNEARDKSERVFLTLANDEFCLLCVV